MSDKQVNSVELDDERERTNRAAAQPAELVKDDGFVSWLNQRMKVAEWDNYQRGSEEFFDIENDLEKLSKVDIDLARNLWKENTPPGMKLPFYLDPEVEKSAARPAGDEKDAGTEKGAQQGPKKGAGEAEKEEGYKVPDAIKRRFLEAENRFYYRDEKNKLAFEDRGRKMTTEHNDPDVAKSLVEIAEAKGWSKIKVAGHDDFKREVWLQAQLKGIEVTGYKAKDVDHARLKELQAERMKNSVERDDSREPAKGKTAERVPDEEKAYGTPAYNKAENFRGKLMEHGRANFDFDEKNDQSYYVKIETENGVRMHWGVDLGRAMEHAAAKIGDMIELERLGKRPVTVQEKQFDEKGNLVGHKPVETERIEWSVNGIDMSKNVSKAADVVVNGSSGKTVLLEKEQQPKAPVRSAEPAAKAKDAEKQIVPAAKAKDAEKQAESNAKTKGKAPALTGDYKVAATVLEKLLKAEGVKPEVLKRVKAQAAERLNEMAVAGKPAPGVKIYDRSAERERPREKVVTKTKEQQQERSR